MTQEQQIFRHIRKNWITPMQAYSQYGITCLAERIRDIREKGHAVNDEWRKQGGKRFKAYRLAS